MKAEELVKEADLYNREGECFIHVESTRGNPSSFLMSGDPDTMFCVIYPLICQTASSLNRSPMKLLREYMKIYRRFGDGKENIRDL